MCSQFFMCSIKKFLLKDQTFDLKTAAIVPQPWNIDSVWIYI